MLMMPPALTTKSGAHRIPLVASVPATLSSASWLLAAPATIGTWSSATVSSVSTPPSAHGANTSAACVIAFSAVTQRPPFRAGAQAPAGRDDPPPLRRVDVGGGDLRSRLDQPLGQPHPDVA